MQNIKKIVTLFFNTIVFQWFIYINKCYLSISAVKCDLIKVKGSSSRSGKGYDRFRLSVPYAGHSMNWDVVFNIESPMMCPDFNFNDDYFLSSIDDEVIRRLEQNVPTYFDWDSSDANSLLRLLMEFLVQYKAHQVSDFILFLKTIMSINVFFFLLFL